MRREGRTAPIWAILADRRFNPSGVVRLNSESVAGAQVRAPGKGERRYELRCALPNITGYGPRRYPPGNGRCDRAGGAGRDGRGADRGPNAIPALRVLAGAVPG